jgi:hypothetical protein
VHRSLGHSVAGGGHSHLSGRPQGFEILVAALSNVWSSSPHWNSYCQWKMGVSMHAADTRLQHNMASWADGGSVIFHSHSAAFTEGGVRLLSPHVTATHCQTLI